MIINKIINYIYNHFILYLLFMGNTTIITPKVYLKRNEMDYSNWDLIVYGKIVFKFNFL